MPNVWWIVVWSVILIIALFSFLIINFVFGHRKFFTLKTRAETYVRNHSVNNIGKFATVDITHRFFVNHQFKNITLKTAKKLKPPFKSLNLIPKDQSYVMNVSCPKFTTGSYEQIMALQLDFILMRSFLALKKRDKVWRYSFFGFMLQTAPSLVGFFFWLCWILALITMIINLTIPGTVKNNIILNILINKDVILYLLIAFLFFYYLLPMANMRIKFYVERDYEKTILKFVKEHYPELYEDFVSARKFSRLNIYHDAFGLFNIGYWINNRYYGPLSEI